MEQEEAEKNLQDLEIIVNTNPASDSFLHSSYAQNNMGSEDFKPDVREKAFYLWYNNNRPGFLKFKELLKQNLTEEDIPVDWSIKDWITDFNTRAYELDRQVHEQVEAVVIAEKVEMMRRHAKTGKYMQNVSLQYISDHLDQLNPNTALRLLVEGVRIEKESRGIPEALLKMSKLTDDEILEEIKQLMTSSSVTLEEVDADS